MLKNLTNERRIGALTIKEFISMKMSFLSLVLSNSQPNTANPKSYVLFRRYLSPSAERRLKGLEYASFPDDVGDEIMYKED